LQIECSQDQNIKRHHKRDYMIMNCKLQTVWEDTVICSTVHCYNIRQQRVRTFSRNISHDVWPLVRFLQEPCNKTLQASPTTNGSTKHYMQKTANNHAVWCRGNFQDLFPEGGCFKCRPNHRLSRWRLLRLSSALVGKCRDINPITSRPTLSTYLPFPHSQIILSWIS
jgi:hypothetical protein